MPFSKVWLHEKGFYIGCWSWRSHNLRCIARCATTRESHDQQSQDEETEAASRECHDHLRDVACF